MKILLIDTCGATGSIALAGAAPSPATASLPGRSAAERLVPTIHSLVASLGLSLAELDAIAVVHGPGSFTGERVGLSAAKGLCHALNLPLVAISRLAVLASLAQYDSPDQPGVPHSSQRVPHPSRSYRDPGSPTASLAGWGPGSPTASLAGWGPGSPTASLAGWGGWETQIHALLDAGRGEFYSGLYANGLCLRESLQPRDQLLAEASREPHRLFVVCEPAVAQSIAELAPQLVAEPTVASAVPLALARIQQRTFDDPATIDANYLRRTDAEIFAKPVAAAQPLSATRPGTPAR
jgi:tRNA threonylcarbamoyl adenosine modification protein YeaZ